MKIWLDDIRKPPDSTWDWATDEEEFKDCFLMGEFVQEISFDNDLGACEKEGWELARWVLDRVVDGHITAPDRMYCHSMNPVARQRIEATIRDVEKHRS